MSLEVSTYLYPSDVWEFIRQQVEKQKSHHLSSTLIKQLPNELLTLIFTCVHPKELAGKLSLVCKKWNIVSSQKYLWDSFDLKKLFPLIKNVIDEKVWKKHVDVTAFGLIVDDAMPPDSRTDIPELTKLFASITLEDDESGVTILTMPQRLTLNKLWKIAESPLSGNKTGCEYIWDKITEQFGDLPVTKTCRVVITNSLLKGSRNLSVTQQQALVNKMGCEMPGVLPVSTLAILTYISSPELPPVRLYGDEPPTYVRCSNKVDKKWNVCAGDFELVGFNVFSYVFDVGDVDVGVAGLKELSSLPIQRRRF